LKKTIPISVTEFKAKCLEIIREVQEDSVSYTITKHNKVVAEVHPPVQDELTTNPLKGSVVFEGDLLSPINESWESDS
jgi:prevent-host-death family protein